MATYGSGGDDNWGSTFRGSYYDDMSYYVEATTGDTYVRSGPGLRYASLGVMYKGAWEEYADDTSYDNRGIAWYAIYWEDGIAWVSSVYTQLKSQAWFEDDDLTGYWTMTEARKNYGDVIQFDVNIISVNDNGVVTLDWGDSGRIRGKWDRVRRTMTVHDDQVYVYYNGVLGGANAKYSGVATKQDEFIGSFSNSVVGSWLMTERRKDSNDDVIQFDVEVISVDKQGNAVVNWGNSGRISGKWNANHAPKAAAARTFSRTVTAK